MDDALFIYDVFISLNIGLQSFLSSQQEKARHDVLEMV